MSTEDVGEFGATLGTEFGLKSEVKSLSDILAVVDNTIVSKVELVNRLVSVILLVSDVV